MTYTEILLLAIGLSMDAFAVSVCKGLAVGRIAPKHLLLCGLWFGGAQALMPVIGYYLGVAFRAYITTYDHWIAFVLLAVIGVSMIREAFSKEEGANASFAFSAMLVLSIATSIDALAVGITFAILPDVNLWLAVGTIGLVTFLLSAVGVKVGSHFGARYRFTAQLCGGILLILLSLKILLEHLGVLSF